MMGTLAFSPNLGFDKLELLGADGGMELVMPAWLVDRPDVLAALTILARNGGTRALSRVDVGHDVVVDLATASVSTREFDA